MRTGALSKITQLLQARVSCVHWAPLGRVPGAPAMHRVSGKWLNQHMEGHPTTSLQVLGLPPGEPARVESVQASGEPRPGRRGTGPLRNSRRS